MSMEREVECQLIVVTSWTELRKCVHRMIRLHSGLESCINEGDLNELYCMAEILKEGNSQEQLIGLSNLLLEALYKSTIPLKFTHFHEHCKKNFHEKFIKLELGSREQIFFNCLVTYYSKKSRCTIEFDGLASDSLIASLLTVDAISEDDMTAIPVPKIGSNDKDIALLAALACKRPQDWMQHLLVGLVQSGSLGQLNELLPGFELTFEDNFTSSLSKLRSQLASTSSGTRHAARSQLDEALDLFVCLKCSQSPDWASASSGSAVPSAGIAPVAAAVTDSIAESPKAVRLMSPAKTIPNQSKDSSNFENPDAPLDLSMSATTAAASKSREPMEIIESVPSSSGSVDAEDDAAEAGRQQMRSYQLELASTGIAGFNSVIVAPTGSGKTLVSIRIAEARLVEDPDGAKVCFLADRKHLVEQQYAAFREQLPERFRQRVACITGGDTDRAPLSYSLRDNSVLLVSTQILLNSLKDKSEDGLNGDVGKLRLIVFDECHNCGKDHPSNKIMDFYFQYKESNPGSRLPQIIGLTASPGTGHASRTSEAMQHLLKLCAGLDCQRLVNVRQCLESLGDQVRNPQVRVHHTSRKDSDAVLECLDLLMDKAEDGLADVCKAKGLLQLPKPPMRSNFLYTNFCGELRAKSFSQCRGSDSGANEVMAAWRCLHHCNVAMLLRSLFRSTDALRYLEEHLGDQNVLDRLPTCPLDADLRQLMNRLMPQMSEFCNNQPALANRSPALAALREILVEQFGRDSDSRVLVFVQQRCFTTAVKDFLDSQAGELAQLGAQTGIMTGTNASGVAGGITQTDQSELLAKFRRGKVKILISTSVTEEGLDVQKCNAVVRFCHVTNEIAMVQSRGRGRAEGSAYHVIVPEEMNWLGWKEQTNQARDAMMQAAVRQIGELPPDEFAKQVLSHQLEQRREATTRQEIRAAASAANKSSVFKIVCIECGSFLTTSSSLRLAQSCHRLALDAELLRDRLEARRESAGKRFSEYTVLGVALLCKICGHRVGSLCRFKELAFPEISILGVAFVGDKARYGPLKKWKLADKFLTEVEITGQDLKDWAGRVPDIPDHLLQTE